MFFCLEIVGFLVCCVRFVNSVREEGNRERGERRGIEREREEIGLEYRERRGI